MIHFKYCMPHVHAYIFSFPFFSCYLVVMFSLSLSLSLSHTHTQIDCAWHPKRVNPLRVRILFKVMLLLLLISFPLLAFGSMMRRPERTSWRTFRNMVFIRSAMLFCWTFPTLFSLQFYYNIHDIDTSVPQFAMTF